MGRAMGTRSDKALLLVFLDKFNDYIFWLRCAEPLLNALSEHSKKASKKSWCTQLLIIEFNTSPSVSRSIYKVLRFIYLYEIQQNKSTVQFN